MEAVVDKLVAELNTFKDTDSANGGCEDILTIEAVYFGDPGIVPVTQYPCFLVSPVADTPAMETTGYEVRDLEVTVTLLIDAREYFEADADEANGDRKMVQTMGKLQRWLRRKANRKLDGLAGVREVAINRTDYLVQVRGSVIAKSAEISVLVNKSYAREA